MLMDALLMFADQIGQLGLNFKRKCPGLGKEKVASVTFILY